jgi:hypothetical protein
MIGDPLDPARMFPVGGRITALGRQPHGERRIDLFGVRSDGRVYTTFSEAKE